jgi:hypothetical protein
VVRASATNVRLDAFRRLPSPRPAKLPLQLTLAVASALVVSIAQDPRYLFRDAVTIAGMALIRTSYALHRTRDPRFLLFIAHGFLHVALLVSMRMRALLTLTDNRWGTRRTVQTTSAA